MSPKSHTRDLKEEILELTDKRNVFGKHPQVSTCGLKLLSTQKSAMLNKRGNMFMPYK
jgi:hypothetical protein